MTNTKSKLSMGLVLGLLMQFYATMAWAQSNAQPFGQGPALLTQVSGQFKSYQNKIGRVAITTVAPLSLKRVSQNSEDRFVGVTLFTQKDVVVSAGIGARFTF